MRLQRIEIRKVKGSQMIDLDAVRPVLCRWASEHPTIVAVLIFGSYAKGTAGPTSDLDIALVIANTYEQDACTIWTAEGDRWENEIRALLGFERIDLEWWDEDGGATPTIAAGVSEAAIPIYRTEIEVGWPNLVSIDKETFDKLMGRPHGPRSEPTD